MLDTIRTHGLTDENQSMQTSCTPFKWIFAVLIFCAPPMSIGQDKPETNKHDAPSPAAPQASASTANLPIRDQTGFAKGEPNVLSYHAVMKMPFAARFKFVDEYPEDPREKFIMSLSGPQRAVIFVDPDDCSNTARGKRASAAITPEKSSGIVVGAAKEVAESFATSLANSLFSGLGTVLSEVGRVNAGREMLAYRDICDVSADERKALLFPSPESQ